jgi:hypothetical protein
MVEIIPVARASGDTETMSTHITQCVVCGEDVACCHDEHALGCGGKHGEGGCQNPPYIEFCSLAHAEELQRRLAEQIASFKARVETGDVVPREPLS